MVRNENYDSQELPVEGQGSMVDIESNEESLTNDMNNDKGEEENSVMDIESESELEELLDGGDLKEDVEYYIEQEQNQIDELEDTDVQGEPTEESKENVEQEYVASMETQTSETQAKKKLRIFTFSRKLLMLSVVPLVFTILIITLFSTNSMKKGLENEVKNASAIVTNSLNETYSNLYEGDYTKSTSGLLMKGETTISRNTNLLDALKESTGFESSLYYDDTRVITTIKRKQGGRAVGFKADDTVLKKIHDGKNVFLKDVEIEGDTYYAYYQPLKNSDGSVVGIITSAKKTTEVKKAISQQTRGIIIVALLIMIATIVIVTILANRMSKTMKKTKDFLAKVADGDLSVQAEAKYLKQNDELGDIYAISIALQKSFRNIVDNIKVSADNLSESAEGLLVISSKTTETVEEVSSSVDLISEGAVVQTRGTERAQDNVQRISEQIEFIKEEVGSLTDNANKMADAEKESEEIIHELNGSNEDTIVSISKVADQINVTNESVQSIRAAIAMIQSIADETDLLSLNASIEAARAGDAGRGFAVVAEQICRLADQSNQTAKKIEQIISQIIDESDKMVVIMDEVKENVDQQQIKLDQTRNKFSFVAEGVEHSLDNIEGISNKITVLGDSGEEILSTVHELGKIAEENEDYTNNTKATTDVVADSMNELADASNNLKLLAEKLNESLDIFKM